jgi:hypothetical protein
MGAGLDTCEQIDERVRDLAITLTDKGTSQGVPRGKEEKGLR